MVKLLRFLVLSCAIQAVGAQGLFKGFIPDENGRNPDALTRQREQEITPGEIIKDCVECPEMVVLPSGRFLMGSPERLPASFGNKSVGEDSERPQHLVQIQSFAIGKYEVTQEQWYAVMGNNPSSTKGRFFPVDRVAWDDAQLFINNLNQKTGQKYRLPSEAEWEYAARAGTTTHWSFGNEESRLGNYAWYYENSDTKPQAVGQKLPNAYGLYDMHGNVWEWTQDCWHESYVGAPTDGSAWEINCLGRVHRGGFVRNSTEADLRSAYRGRNSVTNREYGGGFRLARDL